MSSRPPLHPENHDDDEPRDFDAEFETFMLEHELEIAVEEVYHLSPGGEATEDIRQHNHVVLRSTRRKGALTVCMTSANWDDFPVLPPHVLLSIAVDASMLEESERHFLPWATTLGFDADSRSAERRFRQTVQMADALRGLLGERSYRALLELADEAAAAWQPEEEDDWDVDEE